MAHQSLSPPSGADRANDKAPEHRSAGPRGYSSTSSYELANEDFRYLTKTYLPRKLKEEDWLDWRGSC